MAAQYARPWTKIAADLRGKIRAGRWLPGDRLPTLAELANEYGYAKGTVQNAIRQLRSEGLVEPRGGSGIYVREQGRRSVPDTSDKPVNPPVATAITTCHLGVLVGQRNDGRPPWTFIAGKVHEGESVSDAAVREVKEETGLVVVAGRALIGRRIHPRTGWDMHYVACTPSEGLGVFVGDTEELADVRWVPTVEELAELMGGREAIFAPVLEHLERMLP